MLLIPSPLRQQLVLDLHCIPLLIVRCLLLCAQLEELPRLVAAMLSSNADAQQLDATARIRR